MRSQAAATAALIAVAVSWGAIPLIVREDIPALQLVAARVWLGGAALVALLALQGRLQMPKSHRIRLVSVGAMRAAHWVAFFLALKATTVASSLAVLYLGPIAAAVVAPRLLGEATSPRAYGGLAMAFGGVVLVVQPWSRGDTGVTVEGVVWAAVSAVLIGAVMLVAKPAAEAHGGPTVAAAELVVAAVILSPWAAGAVGDASTYWWQYLVLGVGLTGIAGALYYAAMGELTVTTVSVLMHLEPASATLWALIVLGEQPGAVAWVGVAAVVAGGIMAVSGTRGEEAAYAAAAV